MTECFDGVVKDLSLKGLGIVAHPEGFVCFVPGVLIGEEGQFALMRREKRYGFARLVSLNRPSPHRVVPPCPYQGYTIDRCHGCSWMIMSYDEQLRRKEQLLRATLQRSNLLTERTVIAPTISAPETLGYRNRANVKTDGLRMGFVSDDETGGDRRLVDLEQCLVFNEPVKKLYSALRNFLPNKSWKPGKDRKLNFIELDDEQTDVIHLKVNRRLDFKQANSTQNGQMRAWLAAQLGSLSGPLNVVELFCGSGNFTEVIAKNPAVTKVFAVEGSRTAVQEFSDHKYKGVTAKVLDLFDHQSIPALANQAESFNVLVLDPPRAGYKLLAKLLEATPGIRHIFYISCDLVTFASDVKALGSDGWYIENIGLVDQLPHTPHMEILAKISRTNPR